MERRGQKGWRRNERRGGGGGRGGRNILFVCSEGKGWGRGVGRDGKEGSVNIHFEGEGKESLGFDPTKKKV